jgi:hypothetical protein
MALTRQIQRKYDISQIWQRNYYEHIIRSDRDLKNKTEYIEANPMLWVKMTKTP